MSSLRDYKESWAPKNWCFWTVVSEKTLESPLDCKEIQPILPGASMRNSAHGKGHEEGGFSIGKGRLSLRKPPVPEHLPPKPESAYFTVLCSHLHLWLYRGISPITISLREGVNLQLQLIKIPGCDKSVSTCKLLWRFSSLHERVRPATCDCLQPPNHERHEML